MDFQRQRLLHNLVKVDRDMVHNEVAVARLVHEERIRRRTLHHTMCDPKANPSATVRIEPAMLRELLERLGPIITKQETLYRYS